MNRKHIIVGSILVLMAIVLGSSLAWWTWSTSSNEQTNVVVTVGGVTIDYEDGENITNNNLIPTSTKEQGISKDITVSGTGQAYLNLNMTIVTLEDGLKDASFKYELYNDNDSVSSGNFATSNVSDSISLISGLEVSSAPVTYTLYIWIDGNMSNPNTMYNQNFEFRLNASATDETSVSLETLKKLGLAYNVGSPDFSQIATTDEGIYSAPDDYGTSYYFRGAVENNYVKFAGFYWRIVRINGDGTIRMIYDGTSAHANGEKSTDRNAMAGQFNQTYGDATYVGYMMALENGCAANTSCSGSTTTSSYSQATSNIYDSMIKKRVDSWYKTNIEEAGYNDKIADVIYCNDRSIHSGPGYGINETIYNAFYRLSSTNTSPKLTCTNQNDRFTVDDTVLGNGALTYPIGLITGDEVLMAGSSKTYLIDNRSYYLYTGYDFWTMTPNRQTRSPYVRAEVMFVSDSSYLSYSDVNEGFHGEYYRPVISLKSDLVFQGNGTMESPFEVVS